MYFIFGVEESQATTQQAKKVVRRKLGLVKGVSRGVQRKCIGARMMYGRSGEIGGSLEKSSASNQWEI
jgi:hypothetical protein